MLGLRIDLLGAHIYRGVSDQTYDKACSFVSRSESSLPTVMKFSCGGGGNLENENGSIAR